MRSGWLFSKNAGDGSENNANRPSLDAYGGKWTSPGDIIRLTGPVGPNDHTHLLVGGIGLPDDELGDGHRHYVVKVGDTYQQVTVGAQDHTHDLNLNNNNLTPDWYMTFWVGSDADASAIAADPDNHIIVEADMTQDPETGEWSIGDLQSTPWTVPQKNTWNTRALEILGTELPDEVDRGSRMVKLFLGSLLSRQSGDERGYRYSS